MAMFKTKSRFKEIEVSAIVTRADGTVEDLGVISYWIRKPNIMERCIKWLTSLWSSTEA